MHPFHQFLVQAHRSGAMLDYGCGQGELVREALEIGIDAWGVDTFDGVYTGWDRGAERTRRIVDGRIPFDDGFFDTVVSNQVLEHVADLEAVLGEIRRVLAPNGVTLHVFPVREVLVEVHIGLPLIHRLPPGPVRRRYALLMRRAGFGYFRGEGDAKRGGRPYTPANEWVDRSLAVLDDAVVYRALAEMLATFGRHFEAVRQLDAELMQTRLPAWVPQQVLRAVAKRGSSVAVAAGSASAIQRLQA